MLSLQFPIEIELHIFKQFNKIDDIINYASTNMYRKNILNTHKKFILINNKLLLQDDFIHWYHMIKNINSYDTIKNINSYHHCYLFNAIEWISHLIQNRLYYDIVKILNILVTHPDQDLWNIIRSSKIPIRIHLHTLYGNYNVKLITLILKFYEIYFLHENLYLNNFTTADRYNNYKNYNNMLLGSSKGYKKYIHINDLMMFMVLYKVN